MRTFHFLCLISLCLLAGCQKSEPVPNDPDPIPPVIELGKVAMDRDGQPWTTEFTAHYYYFPEKASFGFITKNQYPNSIEETFIIKDVPCRAGLYPFERGTNFTQNNLIPQSNMSWLLDIDQSLGGMSADTTHHDNFVEVIRYDSREDIVEGKFQVYLKNHWASSPPLGLPDSVRLTNGRFHLKIEELEHVGDFMPSA